METRHVQQDMEEGGVATPPLDQSENHAVWPVLPDHLLWKFLQYLYGKGGVFD